MKKIILEVILMKKQTDYRSITFLCLSIGAVLFAMWTFTGQWFWLENPYNSYILQAQAWKGGHLSLPENYPHLEIAVFNGKYYISFPPFPSYVMFPFVLLGFTNCDGLISFVFSLAGAVYAYKICENFNIDKMLSYILTLLLTIGSNWLFTSHTAWVWFIAQNMAFTLSLMAIYYALKKKCGLSLALWACAVGCRPLNALYLPVILYLIYDKDKTFIENLKSKWKAFIPMTIIGLSYMALNFARFHNPFEFGHNYLPEFTEAENGQFSFAYMGENIKSLFRMPEMSLNGAWEYQEFNGTNIFLISPIFISYIIYTIYALKSRNSERILTFIILGMIIAELLCITAHRTMGGWQFGNRYTNDVLPLVFLGIASVSPNRKDNEIFNAVLLLLGCTINVIGAVLIYT